MSFRAVAVEEPKMSARSVLKHVLAGGMPAAEPGEAEPSTPSATTVYMLGTLPPEGRSTPSYWASLS